MQKRRGDEYVFVHKDLDKLLGVKGQDNDGYRYYLKKLSDDQDAEYGLNAQLRAGMALKDLSGIAPNATDTYKSVECWKDENLQQLLAWIKDKTSYSVRSNTWLIPANLDVYDHAAAFDKKGVITWVVNSKKIQIDDVVYVYVARPDQRIAYKCVVSKVNVPETGVIGSEYWKKAPFSYDESKEYVDLMMVEQLDDERLTYDNLLKSGLNGPVQHVLDLSNNTQLDDYIGSVVDGHGQALINKIDAEVRAARTVFEKEAVVKSRLGQSDFRNGLIAKYKSQCVICGIEDKRLLIASHIIPWIKCENSQKLDVHNGLLLCANHDILFDRHLITFDETGALVLSPSLTPADKNKLFDVTDFALKADDKTSEYLRVHYDYALKAWG